MGIASSTTSSSSLSHHLGRLVRRIHHYFHGKERTGHGTSASMSSQPLANAPEKNLHDTNSGLVPQPSAAPTNGRPLRGSWPFIAKPPPCVPESATQLLVARHDARFASTATNASSSRSAKVLRRASDSGTCRLVIAGRMADVCAELERMAAMEALHGYRVMGVGPAANNVL